ncbi:MAG: shikimate dehydrogenase [Candidatus Omnitrophica bacterium]|nr:shikimate dehydrogenase [Candidatus Omnitrophota bacterium]
MPSPHIYGLIGYPVTHSLSGHMHNAAFRALGLDAEYRLFSVPPQDLESFLLVPDKAVEDTDGNRFKTQNVIGFNITVPHKVRAKEILERHFPAGGNDVIRLIGAINTVKRESIHMVYINTDAEGFKDSLKLDLGFEASGTETVMVLGCGGAARAVMSALVWEQGGVKDIYMYDIDEKTARNFKEYYVFAPRVERRVHIISQESIPEKLSQCTLLVNTTPIGMKEGDPCVIDPALLHKDLFVYDVVYNRDTELIRAAKKKNIPACGGLGMLLYQGVAAFRFWTAKEPPVEIMRNALRKAIHR